MPLQKILSRYDSSEDSVIGPTPLAGPLHWPPTPAKDQFSTFLELFNNTSLFYVRLKIKKNIPFPYLSLVDRPSPLPHSRAYYSNYMTDAIDLAEIEEFAVEVAEAAGQILVQESLGRHEGTRIKMNSVDIVTATDEKVEQYIHRRIAERYPTHDFVGEESYSAGQLKAYLVTEKPTWVVDPLDGTVNYVHLFPMVCVSIGFCVGGRPVAGAIHAPFLHQTYHARRGGGAWLNGSTRLPLQHQPLPANAPQGCIFACEWGKDRRNVPGLNLTRKVASFVNMAAQQGNSGLPGMCHGVRSMGLALLDLCFVATGAFDIWWEGGCWEWDVCAGFIIVEEAGGVVTSANVPEDPANVPEAHLGGRLYLAVRGAADTDTETAKAAQARVARAVWDRVHLLDYERP